LEQQRLSDKSGLSGEAGPSRLWLGSAALQMEEQTGELDVSVAEAIDNADAVLLKDLSRLRSGLICDEQDRSVHAGAGLVDELPRGGRVRTLLDLNGNAGAATRESDEGVGPAIRPAGLSYNG